MKDSIPIEVQEFYKTHQLKKITFNGKELEYLVGGKGPETFLILPGAGMIAQNSFNLMLGLEDRYKVISLHMYPANSISEYCYYIEKILEEEKVKKVILFGFSLGSFLIQSYLRRYKKRVTHMIVFHGCTPKSLSLKLLIPQLKLGRLILASYSNSVVKIVFQKIIRKLSIINYNFIGDRVDNLTGTSLILHTYFTDLIFKRYLTKKLLQTDIRLISDFYYNEKFSKEDLASWHGKILIFETKNDPIMKDRGEFIKLYPDAKIVTFDNTGHLSYYYKFPEVIQTINTFLSK